MLEGVHCVCFMCDEVCTLPVPLVCPRWAKGVRNDGGKWYCHDLAPRKFCVFEFVLVCRCVYVCILNVFVHSTDVCCVLFYMPGTVGKAGHAVGFAEKIFVLRESQ